MIERLKKLAGLLGLAGLSVLANASNQVLVPSDSYNDYLRLVGDRDPVTITDFSGPGTGRAVVEMILIHQALAEAEVNLDIEFVPADSSSEIMDALTEGRAIAAGNSYWLRELTPHFQSLHISTAVLSRGEFEVGFYVHPDAVVYGEDSVSTLRQISTRQWMEDWAKLEETGFEALVHWDSWPSQVADVRSGEISFLIAPFQQGEDMLLELDDRTLAPVPGIKLGLAGSRHMAVSREHPNGALFNSALQLGLLRLKEQGIVERAYIDAGFLQPAVDDWYRISISDNHSDWRIN